MLSESFWKSSLTFDSTDDVMNPYLFVDRQSGKDRVQH